VKLLNALLLQKKLHNTQQMPLQQKHAKQKQMQQQKHLLHLKHLLKQS
jgi:hypothetical protein